MTRAHGGRRLERGTLLTRMRQAASQALESGALQPIATRGTTLEADGIVFQIRVLEHLGKKQAARKEQADRAGRGEAVNPFLPYEDALFVADVSETHVALLNKYNVIEDHLLIVTSAFEDQENLLTRKDFESLWICMAEFDGLGFYNGGIVAGASQRHKHLQLVPLPLVPGSRTRVPIEPLLSRADLDGVPGQVPGLPFAHLFVSVPAAESRASGPAFVGWTHERYLEMIRETGLAGSAGADGVRQRGPYNLLVTREWMLLVPRSREFFGSMSVNALGFAGGLLVRDEEELRALQVAGPMNALRHVGFPRP